MKKGVQKLWAELASAKKPAKLSKQGKQVKLSVVDDIQTQRDYLESAYSELSYILNDWAGEKEDELYKIQGELDNIIVNSEATSTDIFIQELSEPLKKLEDNAKSLGLDPEDIFDEYQETKDMIEDASRLWRDWEDFKNEYPLISRLTNLKF
jgi:chromosome segregation ATPase